MTQRFLRGIPLDGPRLRELRRALAYTQEQLATKADCDVKTVRKAEQSQRLDVATIQRLAGVLGVEHAELMNGEAMQSDQARVQVALAWMEAFNLRDPDVIADLFHDDGSITVMADPTLLGSGLYAGKDNVKRWARICLDAMLTETLTAEMLHIDVCGEYVLIRTREDIRVVSRQTGREVRAAAAHELLVQEGRIRSLRIFSDTQSIALLFEDEVE